MPKYRSQKGFTLVPIIVIIVLLLASAFIVFKFSGKHSPPFIGDTFNKIKDNVPKQNQSALIDGYPHECEKRMGFDNWRTFSSFAIDPQNTNTLYVAVEYKGVFKSQDAGKNWQEINKGLRGYPSKSNEKQPCQEQHPSLVIDPTNSNRLLLTSASSPGKLTDINSENGGLYESTDAGENWHQLFSQDMSAWTYEAIAIDTKNPQTLYVGTTSMPASYDEADPNKIFVKDGIIYKSTDSGKNWKELKTGFVPNLRSGKIFINPKNPNHILFTTLALPSNRGGGKVESQQLGILQSTDGGENWKPLESLPKDQRAITKADISNNFQNIFISANQSNQTELMYFSLDGGKTFAQTQTQVNVFKFDPHDPNGLRLLGFNVYANSRSLFESLDGGKTWHDFGNLPQEASNQLRVSNIVWNPNDRNLVYLNGEKGNVWKSQDGGKTWENILNLSKLSN